ncbi:MAG: Cj0069 family protein [Campylobacteraceae bacterium]|nr:Cj0069 family protein [Campylobacteraceae bacterium]
MLRKKVFVIEYQKEKLDTKFILEALSQALDVEGEVVFYEDDKAHILKTYLKENASCILSRINTSDLMDLENYFDLLRDLSDSEIQVFPHPDTLINLDFKDILVKLKITPLGEKSTRLYSDFEYFTQNFPLVLRKEKIRVLKKNYGLKGKDTYLVELKPDQTIRCTDGLDNKETTFGSIYEFLKFFEPKFKTTCKNEIYSKDKIGFISCKYLPRVSEGEISVLLVKDRVVGLIKKTPRKNGFSTTILSGASYEFQSALVEKYRRLVEFTLDGLDYLEEFCVNKEFPLLWSMDYILDTDYKGKNIYILSEINCSCVDISNHLEYAQELSKGFE